MLRDDQIDLRRRRAAGLTVTRVGKNRVFSEFRVANPASGGQYAVVIRGLEPGDNTCSCPDYRSNTLGTCKHIEAVLETLKADPPKVRKSPVTTPEVFLHYGGPPRVGLRLPARHSDKLAKLAAHYFGPDLLWSGDGRFEDFLPAIQAVPEDVRVADDALEFVETELDRADLRAKERDWVKRLNAGTLDLKLLRADLYAYQLRGALFLAGRGRAILADDMGLGKTVQTLAAVELLARERGVSRVLVVAPVSVKHQWETEIARFTPRAVQVVDGSAGDRAAQYAAATFYRLVNYEQVVRDRELINAWGPDVVVLDEAQRIKNWESKTSREVKKLKSRYAFVLTGTPLENRLEELYSIVQFVDERRFGPAFQFLHDHRTADADGHFTGYRNLDALREKLEPIVLRRTRAEVLPQLPPRTDNTVTVELSPRQREVYNAQRAGLGRVLSKGYVTDADRKLILSFLANMRTVCDTMALHDPADRTSPKLDEFAELLPELLEGGPHKVVAFSQWETMVREAAAVLDGLGIGYAVLTGTLTGKERKQVLDRFAKDAACRVFLSTDAGGVGLNLQAADTVVNFELPWNPAVLDQRIARVHRLGQEKPVRVVNFVARGTIEDRVAELLGRKRDLFAAVFDGEGDEWAAGVSAEQLAAAAEQLLADRVPDPAPGPAGHAGYWHAAADLIRALSAGLIADPKALLDNGLRQNFRAAVADLSRIVDDGAVAGGVPDGPG